MSRAIPLLPLWAFGTCNTANFNLMYLCNIHLMVQYYALRAMVEYIQIAIDKELRQEALTTLTVDITLSGI
jgi:hypothetical protein